MSELRLALSDTLLQRLQRKADRLNTTLEEVVSAALEDYVAADDGDDEPTKEEILDSIRESLQDALAGRVRPVDEVLAELREAFDFDADGLSAGEIAIVEGR